MSMRRIGEFLGLLGNRDRFEAADADAPNLHRLDPLLIYSLLDSLRRYDFSISTRLFGELGVSLETLQDLAVEGIPLGPGQLDDLLNAIAHHASYDDIVRLAGRNSFSLQCARDGRLRHHALPLMLREIRTRLQPFVGEAELEVELRGRVLMLRITNSIFAHERFSLKPLCGFYVGWLQQLGQDCGLRRLDASETRCACQDEDERCCLIHAST